MTDPVDHISEFKSRGGPGRILAACRYSLNGLKSAWRGEPAFRQELSLILPAIALALLLPLGGLQRLLLIGALILVLIVELINSAIEAVVDRISLDRHPLSKNAKDFGSAAVALTVCLAVATWAVVLWPLVRTLIA